MFYDGFRSFYERFKTFYIVLKIFTHTLITNLLKLAIKPARPHSSSFLRYPGSIRVTSSNFHAYQQESYLDSSIKPFDKKR